MAMCNASGKRALRGNKVSHSNRHTIKWQYPNVQRKRIWVEELGQYVRIRLSTRALRTISRVGLVAYARKQGIDLLAPEYQDY